MSDQSSADPARRQQSGRCQDGELPLPEHGSMDDNGSSSTRPRTALDVGGVVRIAEDDNIPELPLRSAGMSPILVGSRTDFVTLK